MTTMLSRQGAHRLGVLIVACLLAASSAFGQGSLRTGTGQTLQSVLLPLSVPASGASFLEFTFGFGTDETSQPGVIADSATVSVFDLIGANTAILVTADTSGFAWAPATPGTLPLNPDDIQRAFSGFPSLEPVRTLQTAYRVLVPIPAVFNGQQVQVALDLFDNLNPAGSTAFISGVTVVPEPGLLTLLMAGGLASFPFMFLKRPRA
jgi:hypothetical protein